MIARRAIVALYEGREPFGVGWTEHTTVVPSIHRLIHPPVAQPSRQFPVDNLEIAIVGGGCACGLPDAAGPRSDVVGIFQRCGRVPRTSITAIPPQMAHPWRVATHHFEIAVLGAVAALEKVASVQSPL